MALEARTSEWQAAQTEKEVLQQQMAKADALASTRAAQQLRLQQQRNSALSNQLLHCKVQLAQMEAAVQQVRWDE